MGTTLDSPLYFVNSTCVLARMSLCFVLIYTPITRARHWVNNLIKNFIYKSLLDESLCHKCGVCCATNTFTFTIYSKHQYKCKYVSNTVALCYLFLVPFKSNFNFSFKTHFTYSMKIYTYILIQLKGAPSFCFQYTFSNKYGTHAHLVHFPPLNITTL